VHHRRLNQRLAGSRDWSEFAGTAVSFKLPGGSGNVDDNYIELPGHPYRAVTLRAYDPRTRLWSIWWLDGRAPASALEPPVRGAFADGTGVFYGDDSFDGRPIRERYIWSHTTPTACRWEQAFSTHQGRSWETNWIMQFTRAD
jgi:hypothetical protein